MNNPIFMSNQNSIKNRLLGKVGRVVTGVGTFRAWPGVVRTYINWPSYFLNLFGLQRSQEATYRLRSGVTFQLRPNTLDLPVLDEIWVRNAYSIDQEIIPKDAIVVDIGGHIGGFAVLAARFARNGKVFCYEPNPDNFRLLERNLELNHLDNVIVQQSGVSGATGEYYLSGSGATASTSDSSLGGIQIHCTELKEVFDQNSLARVHFLKCDCEGAEFDILLNTPTEYLKRIDRIILEYHVPEGSPHSYGELVDCLERANFHVSIEGSDNLGVLSGENLKADL